MSCKSWLGWWWIAGAERSDFFLFFSFFFPLFLFPFLFPSFRLLFLLLRFSSFSISSFRSLTRSQQSTGTKAQAPSQPTRMVDKHSSSKVQTLVLFDVAKFVQLERHAGMDAFHPVLLAHKQLEAAHVMQVTTKLSVQCMVTLIFTRSMRPSVASQWRTLRSHASREQELVLDIAWF